MMSAERLDELDLSIPNLDTAAEERRAAGLLRGLAGIEGVRFVERGALVSYRATAITADEILQALRQAGFRAALFQDSRTGRTGQASA